MSAKEIKNPCEEGNLHIVVWIFKTFARVKKMRACCFAVSLPHVGLAGSSRRSRLDGL